MTPDRPPDDTNEDALYSIMEGVRLDTLEIRESENRAAFPAQAAEAEIIYEDDIVFWFCDTVHEQVFVSAERQPWNDVDRFERVTYSKVNYQRVVSVPKRFFDDYEGSHASETVRETKQVDEPYRMQYGHLYYIVVPPICFAEDINYGAYLVPVEDFVELKGFEVAQICAPNDITPYLDDEVVAEDAGGEPA